MRKSLAIAVLILVGIGSTACAGKLTSQGDSLAPVVSDAGKSVGKTYTLTLEQINIERDATGAYVRLFDAKMATIFVYVPAKMNNKIMNLKRSSKYIYKFTIRENSGYSLKGDLIEVAGADGVPVSAQLQKKGPDANMIILDGPSALGKTFTLALAFKSSEGTGAEKTATFLVQDDYSKEVICTLSDEMAKKTGELKEGDKCKVTITVDRIDWRVFAALTAVEKVQ